MGAAELRYLNNLPTFTNEVPETSGIKATTVWAYTVSNPADFGINNWLDATAVSVAASGIDVPVGTNEENLRTRFKIQTVTSNYKMRPIVAPVVNRMLSKLREWINNRPISEITSNEYETRIIEDKFTNWFRPKTNVYLQHVFGQALNNALTPAMIGSTKTTTTPKPKPS
jgi:hypothetical protein